MIVRHQLDLVGARAAANIIPNKIPSRAPTAKKVPFNYIWEIHTRCTSASRNLINSNKLIRKSGGAMINYCFSRRDSHIRGAQPLFGLMRKWISDKWEMNPSLPQTFSRKVCYLGVLDGWLMRECVSYTGGFPTPAGS